MAKLLCAILLIVMGTANIIAQERALSDKIDQRDFAPATLL